MMLLSALVWTGCGAPKDGSFAIAASRASMPCCTDWSVGAPGTTTSAVDCCPAFGNSARMTLNASFVWIPSGIVLMPDRPVLMPRPLSYGCPCAQ